METVDIASTGHLNGGHDTEHQGPIWNPTLKDQHLEWGDIIPPYTYQDFAYPGQNWTDEGEAILDNGCNIPEPSQPAQSEEVSQPAQSEEPSQPAQSEEVSQPAQSEEVSQPAQSEEPSQPVESTSPGGSVEALTGTPATTPPPTDALGSVSRPSNDGWRLILVTMAALLMGLLVMTPATRRRG